MTSPSLACPNCGQAASGKFCSSCGTALAGATCASCGTPLTPGARFCHRCGTPAGAAPVGNRGGANALPWAVAAIALVALIALVVGQRFGRRPAPEGTAVVDTTAPTSIGVAQMPRAPDISQMSPAERAERLFDRIMSESEAGHQDVVKTFMPMALAAYEMAAPLNLDQHYDVGRIGVVGGDTTLARAEADTILAAQPTHLLGLILAAKAAELEGNATRARAMHDKLVSAAPSERAKGLGEYLLHKNDIDAALGAAGNSTR